MFVLRRRQARPRSQRHDCGRFCVRNINKDRDKGWGRDKGSGRDTEADRATDTDKDSMG